jgi:hypothetical protein
MSKPDWVTELVPLLDREFDALCAQRHNDTEEAGIDPLEQDTIQGVLNELADAALQLRYTYIRIRLTQEKLKRQDNMSQATKEPNL